MERVIGVDEDAMRTLLAILMLMTWPAAAALESATASAAPPANASPAPAAEIIPAAGGDLQHVGEPARYRGDQLFDYINGGAPQFIEYGFGEVVSQELTLGEQTYIFDVYRMHDPLAAFGIFSTRRPSQAEPIGDFVHSSYTPYQGMIAHGPYLIEISAYESSPESAAEMAGLARRATATLSADLLGPDPLQSPPLMHLPAESRVAGSEKLACGPVSLRIALGTAAQGAFFELVESASESVESPVWAIARYHAGAGATTLAILTQRSPRAASPAEAAGAEGSHFAAVRLLADAGEILREAGDASTLPAEAGWIVTSEAGPQLCAARAGENLIFAVSSLPAETFRMWLLGQLVAQ